MKFFIREILKKCNLIDQQERFLKSLTRKQLLEEQILNCKEPGVTSEKYCDNEVIVSLTSYGRRVNSVCYAIESIMQQVKKANRIILWLGEKDYDRILPCTLQSQIARGLVVRKTRDIRSYTKIIPSLIEYPNSVIITVDDDIMYDFDIIGNMIDSYLQVPDAINACRCHVMKYTSNHRIMPYNKWLWNTFDDKYNQNNFFTGVGGVLYPPSCFDAEVFNEDVFLNICRTADDVWLNAMARKSNVKINKVPTKSSMGEDYIELYDVQDMGLRNDNVQGKGNDMQIYQVWEKYRL